MPIIDTHGSYIYRTLQSNIATNSVTVPTGEYTYDNGTNSDFTGTATSLIYNNSNIKISNCGAIEYNKYTTVGVGANWSNEYLGNWVTTKYEHDTTEVSLNKNLYSTIYQPLNVTTTYTIDAIWNTAQGLTYGEEYEKLVKRDRLRSNLVVLVKSRAMPVSGASEAELRALETLREMISESDYRKYLKQGFLLVCGASGDVYQVHRERSHTKVWRDGVLIEEVCVRIKDPKAPPTDNVIAFKVMIEADEDAFLSLGNRYKMYKLAA